jgi:hypothetical protein
MPGTLVISDLSDGTNSTSATNCIQGSAKAWVNFNGTGTPAVRASYNVSSITDNGTGDYTINFTNALPDANYVALATTGRAQGGSGFLVSGPETAVPTTTAWRLIIVSSGINAADSATVYVAIFR